MPTAKDKTKLPTAQDIVQAPQSPPAGSESAAEIPEEVLQIPVMYGLLNGAPPAVWTEKTRRDSEIKTIVKHSKQLIDAGFGFYNSRDGKLAVLYNGAFISDDQLKTADNEGKLTELVPSFDEIKDSFDSAISGAPPEAGSALPGAPVTPTLGGAPPSSRTQNTLATARVRNLEVGSPSSGPVPGRGRILNTLLKSTI